MISENYDLVACRFHVLKNRKLDCLYVNIAHATSNYRLIEGTISSSVSHFLLFGDHGLPMFCSIF